MTEVFKSLCSQDDRKSFCFDKFMTGLQKSPSSSSGVKLYYIVIGSIQYSIHFIYRGWHVIVIDD